MAFIGNTYTTQDFVAAIDYFSGNASTTAFTLSRPVASVAQIQVVVNNVAQNPSSAFTVSGNTITFTSAPSSGTNNIYVYYTSPITQTVALPQNPQVFGNLQFSSSGARITGDFTNATLANRVAFQTSTANSATTVFAIPNGTGTTAGFFANNDSALTNGSEAQLSVNGTTDVRINSAIRGTGTYLPMTFYTGGSERMRVDSSGNLLVGLTSGSGAGARTIDVNGASSAFALNVSGSLYGYLYADSSSVNFNGYANVPMVFKTNNAEQARIDAAGLFKFNSGYGSVATAYGCRAWVNFNGTGTVAIRASGNVSSITDNGTGLYTVNFTLAMTDTNYAVTLGARPASSGTNGRSLIAGTTYSTSAVQIQFINAADTAYLDPDVYCVAVFR